MAEIKIRPVKKLVFCASCSRIWAKPIRPVLHAGDKCIECDPSDDHPDRLDELAANLKFIAKMAIVKKYYAEHPEAK